MLSVTAVEPLDDHRLRVAFDDGVIREVDCSFLFHGALGEPLRDPDYFRQVRVDDEARTAVWPNVEVHGLTMRPSTPVRRAPPQRGSACP